MLESFAKAVMARWGSLVGRKDRDQVRRFWTTWSISNIKRLDELLEGHAQKADATAEARFVHLNADETPEGRSMRAVQETL